MQFFPERYEAGKEFSGLRIAVHALEVLSICSGKRMSADHIRQGQGRPQNVFCFIFHKSFFHSIYSEVNLPI